MTSQKKGYLIAIDGPSGAGKSTVSRLLAKELKGTLMDTGGMYRSIAYLAIIQKLNHPKSVGALTRKTNFQIDILTGHLLTNGIHLGEKLRTLNISQKASLISQWKEVREALTKKQQMLAATLSQSTPIVIEGRDIGSVVFPSAGFKFFITADPSIRARRRLKQLKQSKKHLNIKKILKLEQKRDWQDSHRKYAPLTCPKDAIIIDTSHMTLKEVVSHILFYLKMHH